MPDLEFYSILTEKGKQKEMACLAGHQEFDIWEIAVGDSNGKYYEPESTQTSLKNECWRSPVVRCENEENTRYAIANIPADVGGFTIREIGAYDKEGNLVIVGKFPENNKRLPQTGDIKQLMLRLDLSVVNELILPFIIDPSINTPSVDYVEKHFQALNEKGQPNGYASLNARGLLPSEQAPYISFCVNQGPRNSDNTPALLVINNNTLSTSGEFIYTNAIGLTYKVVEILSLDLTLFTNGLYKLFVNYKQGNFELILSQSEIIEQDTVPDKPINDMIWRDISDIHKPAYIYKDGGWYMTGCTPLAEIEI